jgi:hypothetical protein
VEKFTYLGSTLFKNVDIDDDVHAIYILTTLLYTIQIRPGRYTGTRDPTRNKTTSKQYSSEKS